MKPTEMTDRERARRINRNLASLRTARTQMATPPTREEEIESIARRVLKIETLETRNSDALDFHELAVWAIQEALDAAYEAGRQSTAR